jgi:hypothetical protein
MVIRSALLSRILLSELFFSGGPELTGFVMNVKSASPIPKLLLGMLEGEGRTKPDADAAAQRK